MYVCMYVFIQEACIVYATVTDFAKTQCQPLNNLYILSKVGGAVIKNYQKLYLSSKERLIIGGQEGDLKGQASSVFMKLLLLIWVLKSC